MFLLSTWIKSHQIIVMRTCHCIGLRVSGWSLGAGHQRSRISAREAFRKFHDFRKPYLVTGNNRGKRVKLLIKNCFLISNASRL